MSAAKPALQGEPTSAPSSLVEHRLAVNGPRRIPSADNSAVHPFPTRPAKSNSFQATIPAITAEAIFPGPTVVDGVINGQMGAGGSTLTVKQRPKNGTLDVPPELDGELTFKDMLRVNGHVAGKIFSEKGTLIVDA